jgi:histidine ammonia-lyase
MIRLNGESLNLSDLVKIARFFEHVEIDELSQEKVNKSNCILNQMANSEEPIYGINTGFGHLAHMKIDKKELNTLQKNLLMSHACGVGEVLPKEVVRAMMALRINALIKGYSGIRLEVILKLLELLNKDIIPVVFEKGSLGASGDLALLSHMSLPIIGLGEVIYNDIRMETKQAFKLANIQPIKELHAKEGLSLINGTQAMSAIGGLVLYDALNLLELSNISLSLTMEALGGIIDAYHPLIHEIRNQTGQIYCASKVRMHLTNSKYITLQNEKRVQDAYSIRCAPQVHGASFDAMQHVLNILEKEMNAVTDNPIIFADESKAISAGNFHGQPLALAFDYLGIALSELANISERRIERMVNPYLSCGLAPFLAKESGLNSGFMIVQYTAASIVSENKVLAHPASVDSIPSSANQEDHVSMGAFSARKAKMILDNVKKVISMEIFSACQAIDFLDKKQMGNTTKKVYDIVRKEIPFIDKDTVLYPYLKLIEEIVFQPDFIQKIVEGDE